MLVVHSCGRLQRAVSGVGATTTAASLAPWGDVTTPQRIGEAMDWQMVACDEDSSCALKSDGRVYCWGRLPGNVTVATPNLMDATAVWQNLSVGSVVEEVSGAAWVHVCGARADGRGQCLGDNPSGELGNGTFSSVLGAPVSVLAPPAEWRQFSAGGAFTCGIDSVGEVWCFGGDVHGERGDGEQWMPRPVVEHF
ncbi:MAG: hypothetical protein R3C68_00475 [Myxococcota bacterium]